MSFRFVYDLDIFHSGKTCYIDFDFVYFRQAVLKL